MHPGFEIPGIQNHNQPLQQQQNHSTMSMASEINSCGPVLLSINQTPHNNNNNILEQIHTLPTTSQQLLFDPHNFLVTPPHYHHHHHHQSSSSNSVAFPMVNFKLGLNYHDNEVCTSTCTVTNNNKDVTTSINEDGLLLFRGSEQFHHQFRQTSHGLMQHHHHHSWQDSSTSPPIKQQQQQQQQQPFWEPLAAEVSNENSEIILIDRHLEQIKESHNVETKSRLLFGELEAIYKCHGTTTTTTHVESIISTINQTENPPVIGSEASASLKNEKDIRKKRKKKKKRNHNDKETTTISYNPTAEFFEKLVKQVMEHQENLHKKFAQVIERLEGERRDREEVWRNQELAHFEEEIQMRAKEKAMAESREAAIVSYLEKITGQTINLPSIHHNNKNDED